jgi:hypothetical protein
MAIGSSGTYTLTATYAGEGDFQPSSDSEVHTVEESQNQWSVHLPILLNSQSMCSDFFDDFSNPSSGWHTGEDDEGKFEYLNGEYRVLVKPADFYWLLGAPTCDLENYSVEVDARWSGNTGASYGLIFGVQGDFETFYSFEVNTDYQEWVLYSYESGQWVDLFRSNSPAIHPGLETNHIKITYDGWTLTAEVNGTVLNSSAGYEFGGESGTGLIVNSYSDLANAEASFDNFRVTKLGSSLLAAADDREVVIQQPILQDKVTREGNWR